MKEQPQIFSLSEQIVLKILGQKKMTIAEITDQFYIDPKESPIEPNNYVASVVRKIGKKCDYYKLPWKISGKGSGRHGRMVWKERR